MRDVKIGIAAIVGLFTLLAAGANSASEPNFRPALNRPSDWSFEKWVEDLPPQLQLQFLPRQDAPFPMAKRPGLYSPAEWATAIDSTWGPSSNWYQDSAMWSTVWQNTDASFAGFHGLPVNIWDSIWNLYWPEIADTVSRGRFAAILEYSLLSLWDAHASIFDVPVITTNALPGVPLLFMGVNGNNNHFGAGLTPLPDSTLLVYSAVSNHPLGLQPGDLVLGYDGVPWKDLYPALLAAQLPIVLDITIAPGNTEASRTHRLLEGAGLNWHLFDSIDVVKYGSEDTVRLPTNMLLGQAMSHWAGEQLPVPGVPMPDIYSGDVTSWGIVEGTNIGYIYTYGWFPYEDGPRVRGEWLRALDSLQYIYDVDGLIIDFRTCYGAQLDIDPILERFFGDTLEMFRIDMRQPGGGHFDMTPTTSNLRTIHGDPSHYWDRPIAILTGPGAVSGGDYFPTILTHHANTKVFGKTSQSAYTSGIIYSTYPWFWMQSTYIAYLAADLGNYLNRKPFPNPVDFPWVDFEEVWLTRDGVAAGQDDVVQAALAWLTHDTDDDGVIDFEDNCPDASNPGQEDNNNDGIGNACCCVELTGNVNQLGIVDLSDLSMLIAYLTATPRPVLPCPNEANVNAAGIIDLSDLSMLIAYLTATPRPALPACP